MEYAASRGSSLVSGVVQDTVTTQLIHSADTQYVSPIGECKQCSFNPAEKYRQRALQNQLASHRHIVCSDLIQDCSIGDWQHSSDSHVCRVSTRTLGQPPAPT